MSTILILNGIKIIIWKEGRHKHPHIHAKGQGCEVKINLKDCEAYYVKGFNEKTVRKIEDYVRKNKAILLKEWKKIQE